ncbi:DUF4382 domain-containing protein [Psychroserpens sp.]|uniref:DUF4382 domain-containing protein n=1 Tax=Psychroserpens sp. TaxID=2020870 RepID=UPI003C7693D5
MKFIQTYKAVLLSVSLLFFLTSCSDELETETFDNSSLVTVKLQGTQSVYSQVNIEVLDVQFKVLEDELDPNAWISLNAINTGSHDLASITDNRVITLVDFKEVPSEFIYSIKLVLGDQHTAVKNGKTYALDLNSEYQDTSTNIVEKQLISNKLYDFVIELNLDDSIIVSSEGKANLSPKMNTLMRLYNLF